MFTLPSDVRRVIWARLRFVNAQTNINALLQKRPRPAYHYPYMCVVVLQITGTRVMRLSVAWPSNRLAYYIFVAEESFQLVIV